MSLLQKQLQHRRWQGTYQMSSSDNVRKYAVALLFAVPGGCYELAQREGVPVVISNRYEAVKAKVKLARLRDGDPMVHDCREAVNRTRQSITQASQ